MEQCLRAHSAGAGPAARLGAVAFIHRFGSTLNPHLHIHCVVIDGVFAPAPTGGAVLHPATAIDGPAIATVQAKVRRRLLESFVGRGLLAADDARATAQWAHGGGFSVDGTGRGRPLRYCARPPFTGTAPRARCRAPRLPSPQTGARRQWCADPDPQALAVKIEFNDRYSQASTYHNLGRVATEDQCQWPQAEQYYHQALAIFAEFHDEHSLRVVLGSLARPWQTSGGASLPGRLAEVIGDNVENVEGLLKQYLTYSLGLSPGRRRDS